MRTMELRFTIKVKVPGFSLRWGDNLKSQGISLWERDKRYELE